MVLNCCNINDLLTNIMPIIHNTTPCSCFRAEISINDIKRKILKLYIEEMGARQTKQQLECNMAAPSGQSY